MTASRVVPALDSSPSIDVGDFPDSAGILARLGAASYTWDLVSDRLTWSGNVFIALAGIPEAALRRGRDYARCVMAESRLTRMDAVMAATQADPGTGVPFEAEYALVADGLGAPLWVEDTGRWFAGADGKPARVEGIVRAIGDRHAREEHLRQMAQFDPLTGEFNRNRLTAALRESLSEAARFRTSFGFMLISVDHLARLNEGFGFDVADEVIAAVGRRIRPRLRGCDVLGRFSGNKFGIILKTCTAEDLAVAAERFLASVREEVLATSSGAVAATVSIGGLVFPRHGQTMQDVLSRAQDALDRAKKRRRGSFHAWQPSVEREARRRRNIDVTDDIISALNERRMTLAYEPVVDTHSRAPAFHECLVRLRRPEGEIMQAPDIVPVAEKLGLIRLIDQRVLELVVEELAAAPAIRLSLNVSPETTADADWRNSFEGLLRTQPGVAERLTVEITETSAIQDIDDLRGFVTRVKDLGSTIAIDDFGAGYTSFRNLRRLGVDIVKIDGAFVQNVARAGDDRIFVQTLIDLAARLGLRTVAEWVQDEAAAAMLAGWGCDYLQGRLIGLASLDRPWPRAETLYRQAG